MKKFLREPLFYLLPLLVLAYLTAISNFILVILFLISLFLILKKFKFEFISASIILLGVIVRIILHHGLDENLLLSFACVVLGVALILNLFGNCWAGYLAALVSALWPGFVLTAPRINNDIVFYFGALFCMLFAQRYWRLYKKSDVLLASIGAAIALTAKSSGFVILGVWVIIYVIATLHSLKMDSLRVLIISAFIIILSIGLSYYRSIINGDVNTMSDAAHIENTMGNYLYLDLKDYFLEPYVSAKIDAGGRQYFWNYAIKTSLFGEFRLWDSNIGRIFATALATLALFIFLLALWGMIHLKFKDLPPLLFVIFLFAALIYLRVRYPYPCSNDFRHIFPALFPLVYFAVRGIQILQNSRLRKLSYVGMLTFAALSFAFIVGRAFT